jgi:hypothetical protein
MVEVEYNKKRNCEIRSSECTNKKVKRVANPFAKEINNKTVMELICEGCYQLLCDEI